MKKKSMIYIMVGIVAYLINPFVPIGYHGMLLRPVFAQEYGNFSAIPKPLKNFNIRWGTVMPEYPANYRHMVIEKPDNKTGQGVLAIDVWAFPPNDTYDTETYDECIALPKPSKMFAEVRCAYNGNATMTASTSLEGSWCKWTELHGSPILGLTAFGTILLGLSIIGAYGVGKTIYDYKQKQEAVKKTGEFYQSFEGLKIPFKTYQTVAVCEFGWTNDSEQIPYEPEIIGYDYDVKTVRMEENVNPQMMAMSDATGNFVKLNFSVLEILFIVFEIVILIVAGLFLIGFIPLAIKWIMRKLGE